MFEGNRETSNGMSAEENGMKKDAVEDDKVVG